LEPGLTLRGPAVIQEPAVTLVVPPGEQVSVDDYGNYHVELGATHASHGHPARVGQDRR
jgi:N-methylhydantoinase A